jgi:hypothetical protein
MSKCLYIPSEKSGKIRWMGSFKAEAMPGLLSIKNICKEFVKRKCYRFSYLWKEIKRDIHEK